MRGTLAARDALNRNTATVLGRIAARAVTGPVAFLLGGVIDVLAYAAASARGAWGRVRGTDRG